MHRCSRTSAPWSTGAACRTFWTPIPSGTGRATCTAATAGPSASSPAGPEADAELTLVSTLFHDIGVIATTREKPKADHDLLGGPIARDYLLQNGYAPAFADRVASLVVQHQARERMQDPDTPIELVILMEADMLDERGALGILWDAMAEAQSRCRPTRGRSSG